MLRDDTVKRRSLTLALFLAAAAPAAAQTNAICEDLRGRLADLPQGEPGLLFVTGENVMRGYLNQPAKTAEVVRDGWYNTGDIAVVDDEGYIKITGRQSRFSKIGGEMVPHLKIEESLAKLCGTTSEDGEPVLCVTAVPDEKKGERLIVQKHWGEAYEVPIAADAGGHGGGDLLLLNDVFAGPGDDPLSRPADWSDGIRSIAVGIAGNRSLETGLPVRVEDLGIHLLAR